MRVKQLLMHQAKTAVAQRLKRLLKQRLGSEKCDMLVPRLLVTLSHLMATWARVSPDIVLRDRIKLLI